MKTYSIALVPGDGIGASVTEAAWAVLEKAAAGEFQLTATAFRKRCAVGTFRAWS